MENKPKTNTILKSSISGFALLLFSVFIFQNIGFGQKDNIPFFEDDSTFNKKRTIVSTSLLGGGAIGSISALSLIWYKDIPKSSFHFFDDSKEWLQMDKAGHLYSGWLLSKTAGDLYLWSGMEHKKAVLIGGLYGFGYLLTFEILDGFAADWGFSWSDITANALGNGLYIGQELLWQQQKIKLKFSAHLTSYAKYRPNVLGNSIPERLLKDYNGQTYWLSISPGQWAPKFPKWLCFSLGYGAEGVIYGQDSQPYIPIISGEAIQFNRYRTVALSLDIDLSEIPVKKPWAKKLLGTLNSIKVPFPSVIMSGNEIKGYWLYF